MSALKDLPKLADRLVYIRKIKGLTQADLATLAGTSQQAIQQAECGKALNPRYLPKLAKALEVSSEWLIMNEMPGKVGKSYKMLNEKEDEVLSIFKSMPKKDQDLIFELMKSRLKK